MAQELDFEILGDTYQAAGEAINKWISDNFKTLDPHQIQELANRAQELFLKSKVLFAMEVAGIAANVKDRIIRLQGATNEIKDAVAKAKKVQEIVDIATGLVGIAGKIIGKDFNGLPDAIKDLLKKVGIDI
jgi:hypothetical protein